MNTHNHNSLDEYYQYPHYQEYKLTRRNFIENDDIAASELKPTIDELKSTRSVWYDC